MKHQAIIFVGIQASGKSTFFKNNFVDTHVRINLDMLRRRRRERLILTACLEAKQSFVVDNTNLTREVRAVYLNQINRNDFDTICYYFVPDILLSTQRNSSRGKNYVPNVALISTLNKTEEPSLSEGFDRIYYIDSHTHRIIKEVLKDD